MPRSFSSTTTRSRRWLTLLAVALAGAWSLSGTRSAAAEKPAPADGQAAPIPAEAWLKASPAPVQPGELDRMVARELAASKLAAAPLTTDEQFIRRVTLDLIGQLPVPAEVNEFAADQDPHKRAKLIDRLLDSEEYARHWARYWRDVIETRATAQQIFIRLPRTVALEAWLFDQFKSNRSWAEITQAFITAEGALRIDEPQENGAAGFLLSHSGPDAASERAAETARVFLGIQIQCAQCHDHPSDVWKRQQFHELAAFYGRTRERPVGSMAMRIGGVQLVSAPFGEHQMPSLLDPKKSTPTQPRFLDGTAVASGLRDPDRRKALADFITAKENYWFAGAYVNRIWGELMGQSFYQPIDDMGPEKEAVLGGVLTRLAASYRGGNYDTKALFRTILNSETYQRQIRLGESSDQHMRFAASYPTRLRADALWQSLVNVLGRLTNTPQGGPPRLLAGGMFGRFQSLEFLFKREFNFDPSLKADEVEGSVPQALLLMNNPTINQRIEAKDSNLLARILSSHPNDDDALRTVYLRALARKPTDRELEKCRQFIAKAGSRAEAFEDILWALINSTEFQTKR